MELNYGEIKNWVRDNEKNWEELFQDCEYGYALLQVSDDSPIRSDIHFMPYNTAVSYAGREPQRDDYFMLTASEISKEQLSEIARLNAMYDKHTALCDYVYEKYNEPNRPNIDDGYYGTSASMSDVILIKEHEDIHAFYIDTVGFKELTEFRPYKYIEQTEQGKKKDKAYFEIRDYLLDNDIGFSSECDDYKELFNNVDISSPQSAMQSMQKVEFAMTDSIVQILENNKIVLDVEKYWYNAYANINYFDAAEFSINFYLCETSIKTGHFDDKDVALTRNEELALIEAVTDEVAKDIADYEHILRQESKDFIEK